MIELLFAAALSIQSGARQFAWDFPDAALTVKSVENGKPVAGTITHFRLQIDTQPAVDVGLPVSGTVPGGKTYAVNVPVLPAGTHVAKLFSCALIRWADDPASGTSTQCSSASEVTFTVTTPQAAQTVTVTPTKATPGQLLTIAYTCSSGCRANDWVGIFLKGTTTDVWWPGSYTNAAPKGTYTAPAPKAGEYEVKYCLMGTAPFNCPVVAALTVSAPATPVDCVVSAWSAWSEWAPASPTEERRTRTRTVITPAANGGTPCPPLTETETRPVVPGGTKLDCVYALTFAITTQNNVATVSTPVITGGCK